jgi:hypothetical protein
MKEYDAIKAAVAAMEADVMKFAEKGNSAAGTRVRKGCQEVKRACQALRDAVQSAKQAPDA